MNAPKSPRIAVVGVGIVGVSCALHLQRLGASVTMIDRQEPGGVDSASYGNGGVLARCSLGDVFRRVAPDIYCGPDVQVASTARIVGPAMIGAGCRIGEGAVVIGPTVLADGCSIGDRSWVVRVVTADAVSFRRFIAGIES